MFTPLNPILLLFNWGAMRYALCPMLNTPCALPTAHCLLHTKFALPYALCTIKDVPLEFKIEDLTPMFFKVTNNLITKQLSPLGLLLVPVLKKERFFLTTTRR
jgi:hypothetical protein